ncbi:MAG: hypothetical protein QM691_04135 [Opitutaceae bacterium]
MDELTEAGSHGGEIIAKRSAAQWLFATAGARTARPRPGIQRRPSGDLIDYTTLAHARY